MRDMTLELEEVFCYYCGAEVGSQWGEEGGYRARKCYECGLVYVSPRPRQEDIDEAVRTGEHVSERGSLSVTGRYRPKRVRRSKRLIGRIFGDLVGRGPLRWLRVGAGFGELLKAVSQIFPDVVVTGIEPNQTKRRVSADRGIFLTGERLDTLPKGNFDVVSVMNVWSHLPDPVEFFTQIAALLVHDGLVLVQTGTGGDLESAEMYPNPLFLPDHLSFAGERHVVGILERIGFQVEDVVRKRADTPGHALECFVKRLLGQQTRLIIPYRSAFRTIYVRARICTAVKGDGPAKTHAALPTGDNAGIGPNP